MRRHMWAVSATALITGAVLSIPMGPSAASNTYNDHRLSYGVTGQHYWIESHALPQVIPIDLAPDAWGHYLSQVSYTKTTNQAASRIDWYTSGTVQTWWGLTQFWVNTSQVNPLSGNGVWNRISAVMRDDIAGLSITNPTSDDVAGINHLYQG